MPSKKPKKAAPKKARKPKKPAPKKASGVILVQPFSVYARDTETIREIPRKVLAMSAAGGVTVLVAGDDGNMMQLKPGEFRIV